MRAPTCRNPKCPKPMIPMVIMEETEHRAVFACEPCRDINKVLSVQVVTLPKGWSKATYENEMRGIKRVQNVHRVGGKIRYFR